MTKQLLKIESIEKGITVIRLSDPDRRNAMTSEMAEEFNGKINLLRVDSQLRVVILRGEGKAFSGGGDLDMLTEKIRIGAAENRRLMELFYSQFLSIRTLEVPVIAAINGHAIGAGLCLALGCDIRIASLDAKLGLNFVHLGLHPGMGATYFLPRLVGVGKAAELLYLGKIISAEEAERIGLINQAVAAEKFDDVVLAAARTVAQAGPQAVRALKQSLEVSLTLSLQDCLRREAYCQACDYAGAEFREGVLAAREKRSPRFENSEK